MTTSFPVERPFLPTTEEVKDLYMKGRFGGHYSNGLEKSEYALGFDQWLDSIIDNAIHEANERRDAAIRSSVRTVTIMETPREEL